MNIKFSAACRLLALLCSIILAMWLARYVYTGSIRFFFIGWNIFLGLIPFAAAAYLIKKQKELGRFSKTFLLFTWLLFLPNSFYIITDLIHLKSNEQFMLWYDAGFLFFAALTGIVAGVISILMIERFSSRYLGKAKAMAISFVTLGLSGFGVYLGRFDRFNSWNIINDPFELFYTILHYVKDPVVNYRVWGISLVLGGMFMALYLIAKALPKALRQ